VIAQFYATLYVEEDERRSTGCLRASGTVCIMMLFVVLLGFTEDDLQRDRIHTKQVLPPEQLAFMYPLGGERGVVGKVLGLHPTYRYPNRIFKKTIDCKGGDKGNIADYSRNLLHRMAPDA